MYKVDLHTHSSASPDGGITAAQYHHALTSGLLDVIAVTDHNRIDVAQALQRDLGDKIIVGEEIMTTAGEVVGLYLTEAIPAGLTPLETVQRIKDQHGLVYIPHPFETVRKGLHPAVLEEISDHIDLMEIYNGRAFAQDRSQQAVVWAKLNHIPGAASSDAHGLHGLGKTYTTLPSLPTRDTLLTEMKSATPVVGKPTVRALLYPKYHRLRKKLGSQKHG